MHLVGFIIRNDHDARSPERRKSEVSFQYVITVPSIMCLLLLSVKTVLIQLSVF